MADSETTSSAALHRGLALWVDSTVDVDLARSLSAAGVSTLVVRRGRVDLGSGAPVLHLTSPPVMGGEIPIVSALRIESGSGSVDPEVAKVLWRALEPSLGPSHAEILLDLTESLRGMDAFVRRFRRESGLSVVPVLTLEQLATVEGILVAQAAGECVVPLFGAADVGMRGLGGLGHDSLQSLLQGFVGQGFKIRPAVVIRPRTEPRIDVWGEDLNALCEAQTTDIGTSSRFHRSFVFGKAMSWGGRSWAAGDRLEVAWMDASRIDAALREIDRLVMPEVSGWDLFTFPTEERALGIGSEALLQYLRGRGPEPEIEISVSRQGRTLRVTFANRSPFTSAVTAHGNWLEVSATSGSVMVRDRGGFDRVSIGDVVGGRWRDGHQSNGTAVRFGETYIGPGEKMTTGQIRLPSSRSVTRIRWRVVLSDGTSVTGSHE